MELQANSLIITLQDEPTYSRGSADNVRAYEKEFDFASDYQPTSRHGVRCSIHSCILLAGRGASGVHEHSAVIHDQHCFVAVGDMVCCLTLPTLELLWATKVDQATCFGVYYSTGHECLLSHGELEIARISLSGEIVWTFGGRDIFSEGFKLAENYVEAIDFGGFVYRAEIATGRSPEVTA